MERYMPLFSWFDKYCIGNEEIDSQHKVLFEILNRLYHSSYESENINAVYGIIDELILYSDYHFKAEQQYMIDIGYKDIDKQLVEHDYFTSEILRLKQSNEMDASELTKETIIFLGRWLLRHVTEEDKKISL
jgi:hemerythrin-like metal-binding protein